MGNNYVGEGGGNDEKSELCSIYFFKPHMISWWLELRKFLKLYKEYLYNRIFSFCKMQLSTFSSVDYEECILNLKSFFRT